MRDCRFRRSFSIFIILFVISLPTFGQSTTSLRGTVTDASGAIIPGVVVSLNSTGTGSKRQVVTGENGVYQFLQIPPGTYQVSVEKPGFATLTRDSVQLQVNTPATLDLRMEVGSTSDVVNVAA